MNTEGRLLRILIGGAPTNASQLMIKNTCQNIALQGASSLMSQSIARSISKAHLNQLSGQLRKARRPLITYRLSVSLKNKLSI